MTIAEVAQGTGKSEQSIRRAIKAGKLKATLIDGRYDINEVDLVGDYRCDSQSDSQTIDTDSQAIVNENEALKQKISELEREVDLIKSLKDERIGDLQKQIDDKRQEVNQQQAIIMQLSRNQQLMLESSEQKERRSSWWSRIWKKENKKE